MYLDNKIRVLVIPFIIYLSTTPQIVLVLCIGKTNYKVSCDFIHYVFSRHSTFIYWKVEFGFFVIPFVLCLLATQYRTLLYLRDGGIIKVQKNRWTIQIC